MKKRICGIILLLLITACLASSLSATESGKWKHFSWTVSDDGVLTISGYGEMDELKSSDAWRTYSNIIQTVILEKGITKVGEYAFGGFPNLKSVSLPDTVVVIGSRSFSGCSSLETINIPEGVYEIGDSSFYKCTSLQDIIIPSGVEEIASYTFRDAKIKKLWFPKGLTKIWGYAFERCKFGEVCYEGTQTDRELIDFTVNNNELMETTWQYNIPKPVLVPAETPSSESTPETESTAPNQNTNTNINNNTNTNTIDAANTHIVGAFSYTLDNNTATIAAPKSKAAKTVTIPATVKINGKSVPVTSIAPNAFKGMKNLTSVTIGKNVKKIGKNAFNGCKKLKKITIKTTKLTAKTVSANAFKGINKKAVFKCPKSKKAAYKKILLKKGAKKTMSFK